MTAIGQDRAIELPFTRDRVIAVAVATVILAVMIVPRLGYVPVWDGRVYTNCVLDAAFSGVSMQSLRCAGHPSQGWAAVLVVPQLFAPGSVAVFHATDLVLAVVAVVAFRVVLARVFPGAGHARALDLVAIAAAIHPAVVSTLLQPNVDFGVYVYFYVALAGLLSPGVPGTVAALVGGTLLCFSKETGVAAYGLAVATVLVTGELRARRPLRQRVAAIFRRGALLSAPMVLFIVHVLTWDATHESQAIWKHTWQTSTVDGFNFFNLSDPIFVSYAAALGVLGFMWVAWLPVAVDALAGLARMSRRGTPREVAGADRAILGPLIAFTAVLTYLLTSFRTWSNLRYFALLFPLFLLVSYVSLVRLGAAPALRRAAFLVIIALLAVADYRSVDPLSRAVYGTFDTGVRRMYRMSSITGEYPGPGRDELVYNLEFADYDRVQDALFDRIHPTDSTVIGTARDVRWNLWSQLDDSTRHRTMRRDDVFAPVYADEVDIAARRSPRAWFLDFSNKTDGDHALATLLPNYDVTDSVVVVAGSQRVVAHHLVRREAGVLP